MKGQIMLMLILFFWGGYCEIYINQQNVTCSGNESCTVICSNNACHTGIIKAIFTSTEYSLNVICNDTNACMVSTIYLSQTETAYKSDNITNNTNILNLSCIGQFSCSLLSARVSINGNVNVNCQDYQSCASQNMIVTSPHNKGSIYYLCNGTDACQFTSISGTNAKQINVTCLEGLSCPDMEIYAPLLPFNDNYDIYKNSLVLNCSDATYSTSCGQTAIYAPFAINQVNVVNNYGLDDVIWSCGWFWSQNNTRCIYNGTNTDYLDQYNNMVNTMLSDIKNGNTQVIISNEFEGNEYECNSTVQNCYVYMTRKTLSPNDYNIKCINNSVSNCYVTTLFMNTKDPTTINAENSKNLYIRNEGIYRTLDDPPLYGTRIFGGNNNGMFYTNGNGLIPGFKNTVLHLENNSLVYIAPYSNSFINSTIYAQNTGLVIINANTNNHWQLNNSNIHISAANASIIPYNNFQMCCGTFSASLKCNNVHLYLHDPNGNIRRYTSAYSDNYNYWSWYSYDTGILQRMTPNGITCADPTTYIYPNINTPSNKLSIWIYIAIIAGSIVVITIIICIIKRVCCQTKAATNETTNQNYKTF